MSKLIRFTSPTCGMCKQVARLMSEARIEHEVVDVTEDEDTAVYYGVQHLPTIVEVDEFGNIIARYNNYGEIIKLIKEYK